VEGQKKRWQIQACDFLFVARMMHQLQGLVVPAGIPHTSNTHVLLQLMQALSPHLTGGQASFSAKMTLK
jgi:hypothetical protein